MNFRRYKEIALLIFVFAFGLVAGLSVRKDVTDSTESATQDVPLSKQNVSSFPWLDLPVDYFSDKDVQWGSAGNWEAEKGIKQYTSVALGGRAVYQSYPTTSTTIGEYSNEVKPLEVRNYQEVLRTYRETDPDGFELKVIEENYKEYGVLATNYFPEYHIQLLQEFDVDTDDVKEKIVEQNYVGRADAGSYGSDIVKGNNIIFSVREDNSRIVPADTNNGFYLEWNDDKESPECCEIGYMRTRFVLMEGVFKPIYEQKVVYLKVGKAMEN